MANVVYNDYKSGLVAGTAGISTGTSSLHCAVLTSGYSIDETHHYSDISPYIADNGSNKADQEITGVTVTTTTGSSSADDTVDVKGNTVTWASSNISGEYALVYIAGQTNIPVCVFRFDSVKSSVNGDFSIIWNGSVSDKGTILQLKQASSS